MSGIVSSHTVLEDMMRTSLLFRSTLLTILVVPTASFGQSVGDFAAWAALTSTPAGGLPSSPFLPVSLRGNRDVQARYGRLNQDGFSLNIAGLSLNSSTKNGGQYGATIGSIFCEGCDASLMVGFDGDLPLKKDGALLVALRPAVGLAKFFDEGGGSAISGALSMPISALLGGNGTPTVIPFIDPGYGFGRISEDSESESGFRPILGGGLAIIGARIGLNVSAKRVFLEGGKTLFGAGLTFAVGR